LAAAAAGCIYFCFSPRHFRRVGGKAVEKRWKPGEKALDEDAALNDISRADRGLFLLRVFLTIQPVANGI